MSGPRGTRGSWKVIDRLLGRGEEEDAPREDRAADDKLQTKERYDEFNRKLNQLKFGKYAFFLNYGYVANDGPSFSAIEPSPGQFDINSRRLVLEVIGDCQLDGRDILDVSCGRGSVCIVLLDHFHPRSYLGIDISTEAVEFCRREHRAEGYRFAEGDAEDLELESSSVDVVINVEASHNYPRIDSFFRETNRVLRPGGWFLYTDLMPPEDFDRHRERLGQLGLELRREADITRNVLLSCEQTAERRLKVYRDPEERAFMADFLAAPGSGMYRAFQQGRLCYRLFAFRKHNGAPASGGPSPD